MKRINEMIVRKDSSIHKVQFDKEWFYSIEDMEDFLKKGFKRRRGNFSANDGVWRRTGCKMCYVGGY